MSTRRAAAPEVRESIEAKAGDEDVDMKDDDGPSNHNATTAAADADIDMDAEGDEDAEGEPDDEAPRDMFDTIHNLSTYLCEVEEEYVVPNAI